MSDSIWKQLNREVSFAKVGAAFRSVATDSASSTNLGLVDRVLDTARAEAERRGVNLEVVLRERGFDLPDEVVQAAALRMSQNLPAVVDEPEKKATAPTKAKPAAAAAPSLDDWLLTVGHGPWAEVDRARAVEWVQSPIAVNQAFVAGLLSQSAHSDLLAQRTGPELATKLLGAVHDSGRLRDLLECQSGAAAADKAQLLVDRWLEGEMLSYKSLRETRDKAQAAKVPVLATFSELDADAVPDLWLSVAETFSMELAQAPSKPVKGLHELAPWARAYALVPVRHVRDNVVVAVSFSPPDWWFAELKNALPGKSVQLAYVSPLEIEEWRSQWMTAQMDSKNDSAVAHAAALRNEGQSELNQRMKRVSAERSAVSLVQEMFDVAVLARATDIHVEPFESAYRIRLRVDGVCSELVRLEPELSNEFLARIKILADMDVTERRRPQDGSMRVTGGQRTLDLRLSTLPTRRGEKLAIRIADGQSVALHLSELGLSETEVERVRDIARRPHGLLLTTGPVGSGKTTTLYSCLNELDRTSLHIASIEDPVEIELEGTNQVEVNRLTGVDFPSGLRALLRQDPDVMLIGEIRDIETAQIGVRAAMTGRMVYSTLHANSAAESITTLRNFGIQNFIVASTLQGTIAQRLVRRVCQHCSVAVKLSREELGVLGLKQAPRSASARRGTGCPHCGFSGYRGRVGIYELLTIEPNTRDLIEQGARASLIENAARENGSFRSLREAAVDLVLAGSTTTDELLRVLGPNND